MPDTPFLHVRIRRTRDDHFLLDEMVDVTKVADPDALIVAQREIADAAVDQGETVEISVVDPDGVLMPVRFLYGPWNA